MAIWYAEIPVVCLVSDWLSGLQEDHVVLYEMTVWYAGILSVVEYQIGCLVCRKIMLFGIK